MTPEARRLRRKLLVRQAKRERGLPLFDLDQAVNAALLLVDGIYGAKEGAVSRSPVGQATYRTTSQDFRILDRYPTMLPATKGYHQQTCLWEGIAPALETCMGKDVTLHISASNPAMLLYQKFGFKTEKYILDFHDKNLEQKSAEMFEMLICRSSLLAAWREEERAEVAQI
ncbi:cysteine-rich protein 2-binding protein-like [Melospiza melodia melodia]|uniref:cysteine-rich protein 2-binding protein-like n=1 Tax=Melospiza melodia melodia TaxID=1914991 RepID=UPI002FD71413